MTQPIYLEKLPPYQLSDGGHGTSARPIYHEFVIQAKKLNPSYLIMIIPARWFAGGKGLDQFRNDMLNDQHVKELVDYFDSTICFPGVDISGGVCYFLWDSKHQSSCTVKSVSKERVSVMQRHLLEPGSSTFLRFNESIPIIRKIRSKNEGCFSSIVSSRKPFGFGTQVPSIKLKNSGGLVKIYAYPNDGFVSKTEISRGAEHLNKYKVLVSKAYGERGSFPYLVIAKPFLGEPNSCCSETYLLVGSLNSKQEAENVISYMKTRFFRFLVLQIKNTQDATSKVYELVPLQDFTQSWTDEKLYAKYGLTPDEIAFIESMIRPMELNDE